MKYNSSVFTKLIAVGLLLFQFHYLYAQSREEFAGPFASWANVKTRFGAKGDGKTDDTRSFQTAIENFSNPSTNFNLGKNGYMVIYVPAGTYIISKTLQLKGKAGVSIIGEDPGKTIIKWAGAPNDTILWANGSSYFKISRFTFDAGTRNGMEGIGIHWKNRWDDGKTRSFAPLNIEISDIFFSGFNVGIGGGTYKDYGGVGANDSEITIRRCNFVDCTDAGIKITGFNAYDYWIWYCRFIRCRFGIYCSNGNYHVYRSLFKYSSEADMYNKGGYYTSARQCFSEGAAAFSKDEGASCNPFKRVFESNTVNNPKETAIEYHHLGSITLLNNKISNSSNKKVLTHANLGSWCQGNYVTLALNNNLAYQAPVSMAVNQKELLQFNDAAVMKEFAKATTANSFESALPGTPAKVNRTIFEVPVNASGFVIQEIINKASKLAGTRPVVHFPMGIYYLDVPLTIPAGSDMQLIGDGLLYASVIQPRSRVKFGKQYLINIQGPSFISIIDMQIGSNSNDKEKQLGILFRNVDQQGARLIMDQVYSSASTSISLEGLNYLYVEKNNSFFTAGNYLSGGSIQKAGKGTFRMSCFGGQFARLTVQNNAQFIAKDCWWEGRDRIPLELTGDGNITIDGAMIAPYGADSTPSIAINRFAGNLSLQNMYIQGGISVNPANSKLNLLGWNLHFYYKMDPIKEISGRAKYQAFFSGITSQCFDKNNPACAKVKTFPTHTVNVTDKGRFLQELTKQTIKNTPSEHNIFPKGASNIYISRALFGFLDKGLTIIN